MNAGYEKLTVLVIEDNEGDFLIFEEYLKLTGLRNVSLVNAQRLSSAFETLETLTPDIVFLDLSLPDISGVSSFVTLNKLISHIPVVVLSGLSDKAVALECISMGAQDYLLKNDLNPALLEKSIQYSIERKKNLEKIRVVVEQYELIGKVTNDVIWHWKLGSNEIKTGSKEFFDYKLDEIKPDIKWWLEKIHNSDKAKTFHTIEKFLEGKDDSTQAEYRFRCANNLYRYVFNRAYLLRNDDGSPKGIIGAMMDVTERKFLEEELLKRDLEHQKELIEANLLGQEKEKEAIGKELHDNINQVLASVKLYLETALKNEDMRDELLPKCRENTVLAIEEIRKLSHSLIVPSLGDLGLVPALNELADHLNISGLYNACVYSENFIESAFGNDKKLMIYRIAQEQINNIIKYSKATDVQMNLKLEDSKFKFSISDNGVGFDPEIKSKGIGLKNIESRVTYYHGHMRILSSPGKGTQLKVQIPLG